jgi:hypothetical protein
MSLLDLLFDLLVPAAIAFGVLAFAWRRRASAPRSSDPARVAGSWAFGLAMLVAYGSIFREFVLPAHGRQLAARDWIPPALVASMLFASLALVPRVRRVVPSGGAPLVLALLVVLSLRTLIGSGSDGLVRTLLVFAGAMATWTSIELSSERLRGPLPCLVLALATAGSALTIGLASSVVFGRLCGALAVLFVVAAVIAWRRRVFTLSGGPAAIASLVLVASWVNAWVFAALPTSSVLLLCAAVVVPSYGGIGPLSTWKPLSREVARTLLALALAASALWIAQTAPPAGYGS